MRSGVYGAVPPTSGGQPYSAGPPALGTSYRGSYSGGYGGAYTSGSFPAPSTAAPMRSGYGGAYTSGSFPAPTQAASMDAAAPMGSMLSKGTTSSSAAYSHGSMSAREMGDGGRHHRSRHRQHAKSEQASSTHYPSPPTQGPTLPAGALNGPANPFASAEFASGTFQFTQQNPDTVNIEDWDQAWHSTNSHARVGTPSGGMRPVNPGKRQQVPVKGRMRCVPWC